jgi:transposase
MTVNLAQEYVGIDVSKTQLDVAIGQKGEYWQANNDAVGIIRTVEHLKALQPALIVVESTGGLEVALITELFAAQLPFALVHPKRVRDFARSIGLLAKTDKLDARLLSRFGKTIKPPVSRLPGVAEQNLNAFMLRRRQLLDILVMEKNHLFSTRLSMRTDVEKHIVWLEAEIADLDQQIDDQVHKIPIFKEKEAILRSAKGVGPVLCAKLLSGLPELGLMDRK